MLESPINRIWPSAKRAARSKTARHVLGLRNGSAPSITSISASAPSNQSSIAADYLRGLVEAAGAGTDEPNPVPRIARKKSLFGSSTIKSPLVRKVVR
jgi:hypothetical protein